MNLNKGNYVVRLTLTKRFIQGTQVCVRESIHSEPQLDNNQYV